jgi:acyl dehydratase
MLAFEDLTPGRRWTFPPREVTREEIVSFAREYDPQPFHLDEAAAKASPFGGLVASGWHTACLAMRMLVDGLGPSTSLGSPGVDELRWIKPVRPGDLLSLSCEVVEATPSRSRPDRGSVRLRYELSNQQCELVFSMIGIGMFGRRPG